jgi:hypothetical protein
MDCEVSCEPVTVDTGVEGGHHGFVHGDDLLQKPAPYFARAFPVASKPGCWNTNRVEIVERDGGNVIGEYNYGYSSIARTFHPFQLRGKWYALYSREYTATRIMSLPDCRDLGGEKAECWGFCPTDYYVPPLHYLEYVHDADCPRHSPLPQDYAKACTCKGGNERLVWHFPERVHGFIAGCVWGDDSSWKIQYLDLSHADEGIIKRDERFGYIELPDGLHLDQAVHLDVDDEGCADWLTIDVQQRFRMKGVKEEVYSAPPAGLIL